MGMFDWYEPAQQACPVCDRPIAEWQGKDGPNLLFVWRQGTPHPVDQRVDDVRLPPAETAPFRLPSTFTIYAYCCGGASPVEALCGVTSSCWNRTRIVTATIAAQLLGEPNARWLSRRAWLSQGRPDRSVLLTVQHAFHVANRGVMITPGLRPDAVQGPTRVPVELQRPDGVIVAATLVVGAALVSPPPDPEERRWACVLTGVAVADVPPGTQVRGRSIPPLAG